MEVAGVVSVVIARDIGREIRLAEAEARLRGAGERRRFGNPRRAPTGTPSRPPPLRVRTHSEPLSFGSLTTAGGPEIVLFDFGGALVVHEIPFAGPLEDLTVVSHDLYDHEELIRDSGTRLTDLLEVLGDSVVRPGVKDVVEDYAVFEIRRPSGAEAIRELLSTRGETMARILRAEPGPLSAQETAEALSQRLSYGPDDAVLIDWFAAILMGEGLRDERVVLEYATAELLELRLLDEVLDAAVDQAYRALSRRGGVWEALALRSGDLRRIGGLQADCATIREDLHNSVKLLGDQYLARMYRVAAQRFHTAEWDAGIARKLEMLGSIHEKIFSFSEARRMEVLEWIIILLIAVSIAVYFIPD